MDVRAEAHVGVDNERGSIGLVNPRAHWTAAAAWAIDTIEGRPLTRGVCWYAMSI